MRSVFTAVVLACAATFAAAAGGSVVLAGHVTRRIFSATALGRAAAGDNVDLSLVVRLDQARLDAMLASLYGPGSPKSKRFLTPSEFANAFDLATKRQALKDFARATGLTVSADDHPNSQVVKVSGPASLVEKAFSVRLNRYRSSEGQFFRANDGDPSIPSALAPHLRAVLGLSNYRGSAKPHFRRRSPAAARRGALGTALGSASPRGVTGSGPAGGLSPADIKSIYRLTAGHLTGSGQTLAIVELDGYNASDITLYEQSLFAAPYPTANVNCLSSDGACGLCVGSGSAVQNQSCASTSPSTDSGMIEVALDIDMAIALSSGAANIKIFTALNQQPDFLNVYSDVAADGSVGAVSTSWGQDEEDAGTALMGAENSIFKQMAAQGQSMFSAAGDFGAYDAAQVTNPSGGYQTWDNQLLTDDPASQPYVTGVGGTSLSGTVGGSILETTWNNGCLDPTGTYVGPTCTPAQLASGYAYEASGGGVANYVGNYWSRPSYQSGVIGTTGQVSQTYRNVPDVALNADPNAAPYNICVGGTCLGGNALIAGTSAAAPLWAALTNLVNQARASGGYSRLGFANPSLYALAANGVSYGTDFNDVVSGNNGYYNAGTGYDNATGWGSFKADALIAQLSSPSTAAIQGATAFSLGISSIEWNWTAAADTAYNVYYATQPTTSLALAVQPPFVQTGLLPNATAYIVVYSTIDAIRGSAAAPLSTATYAEAPASTPIATGFASSATFTYAACPAAPSPSSCSGYLIQVATTSSFAGAVLSSATSNSALTALTVAGLSGTSAYARLATLNPGGAPSFGPAAEFFLNAVVPASPGFSAVSTGTITFAWSANGNPPGMSYTAQASTAADYSGTLHTATGAALSATFASLAADTSYYFRVQGVGGPFLSAGPQATLAAEPGIVAPAFVAVGSTTLTAQWASAGNAPDATYEADLSASASFAAYVSSVVASTSAAYSGLGANTAYYARVRSFGRDGTPTAYRLLGSTLTLTAPPSFPTQPFAALSTGSFTASFNTGGNAAGTVYVVQASTNIGFTPPVMQTSTAGATAAFAGLLSNAAYYVQVAAQNSAGALTAFSAYATTATLVAVPAPGAAAFAASASALAVQWSTAGFAAGTSFSASVSLTPSPFTPIASAVAVGSAAVVSGLAPNTTYFAQIAALSASSDPNGAPGSLGSGSTLSAPVSAASFQQVFVSTMSVGWMPASGNEGYRVDLSTTPTFTTLSASVFAPASASSALISGLFYDTTYYARVGALNWQNAANYYDVSGATTTGAPTLSTGTAGAGALVLTLPLSPPLISLTVTIPAGAFPAGTSASAIAGFFGTPLTTLSGASSNESAITPTGPQAAFCVSGAATCLYSGGPQPSAPVLFSISYNPGQLPSGFPESALQLMRFDPAAGQWTLVSSQDDAAAHVLTAYTTHFSLYAPFFMTAATPGDLSPVQIFPQPWELGAPGSPYYASVLTFSNLPAGAEIKLFTLAGELVWEGAASGSGVATWDGRNRFGRAAASGTYLCSISSGGAKRLRRVVLIR